jgi:hypothetical protein
MTAPERLIITEDADHAIVLTEPDGHVTRLVPDGKKQKEQLPSGTSVERKTSWEDGMLVSEIAAGDAKVKQSYQTGPNDGQLTVSSSVDNQRSGRSFVVRRVYERAAREP